MSYLEVLTSVFSELQQDCLESLEDLSRDHDALVAKLFERFLIPPPAREYVNILATYKGLGFPVPQPCAFVVNECSGRALMRILDPSVFLSLPLSVQVRVIGVVEAGLRAGLYSIIRLRLSCEGGNKILRGAFHDTLPGKLIPLLHQVGEMKSDQRLWREGLLDLLGRVLGRVCRAGLKVSELKAVLKSLSKPSDLLEPLLTSMTLMLDSQPGAQHGDVGGLGKATVKRIFSFGGEGSGLFLPEMTWPFPHEYQIAFLLRVENFRAASQQILGEGSTEAHLVTLMTEDGAGIDVILKASRLCFIVGDCGRKGLETKIIDLGAVKLEKQKWHMLVFLHSRPGSMDFLSNDQLQVYMDERLVFSGAVPYPRCVVGPLTQRRVGWDFDGQMAGVLMLRQASSVEATHAVLRSMAGESLYDSARAKPSGGPTPDLDVFGLPGQAVQRGKLLSSHHPVLTAYLPCRIRGRLCLDLHSGVHAQMRGRTDVWVVHEPQDMLGGIGGMGVLLFLSDTFISNLGSGGSDQGGRTDRVGLSSILQLLAAFLADHEVTQREMQCLGGVDIMEHMIRSAPRHIFAGEGEIAAQALERFCIACCQSRWTPKSLEQSPNHLNATSMQPLVGPLERQAYSRLLGNFALWVQGPPDLQFSMAARLLDMVQKAPSRFRGVLPVDALIHSIGVYYKDQSDMKQGAEGKSLEDLEAATAEANGWKGRGSGSTTQSNEGQASLFVVGRRERQRIRGCLWGVLMQLLREEANQGDVSALLNFMATCGDPRLVCEATQLLGLLMRQEVPPLGLFQALRETPGQSQVPGKASMRSASVPPSARDRDFLQFLWNFSVDTELREDLLAAGLRCTSVYMARVGQRAVQPPETKKPQAMVPKQFLDVVSTAVTSTAAAPVGMSTHMDILVSFAYPVLLEILMRRQHMLAKPAYAALLEMAILHDEGEVPWSDQIHIMAAVNRPHSNDSAGQEVRKGEKSEHVSWDWGMGAALYDVDANESSRQGEEEEDFHVLDGAQDIHHMLPLVLLLQLLPSLPAVQVHACEVLLLMMKLNEENISKVVNLSHSFGGGFRGLWQRSLFQMMAPMFARRYEDALVARERKAFDPYGVGNGVQDMDMDADYYMVVKLYTTLLEHAVSSKEDGYKEIDVAASLQSLTPHGRGAVHVLLAELAVFLQQHLRFGKAWMNPAAGMESSAQQGMAKRQEIGVDILHKNVIHLIFMASDMISEDISTASYGLFHDRKEHGEAESSNGSDSSLVADRALSPLYVCTMEQGRVALATQVLRTFDVLTEGNSAQLWRLCEAQSMMPDQGPLLYPLLRLSLFLLANQYPCGQGAQETASRIAALLHYLVSYEKSNKSSTEIQERSEWCIVTLVHLQASLSRIQAFVQRRARAEVLHEVTKPHGESLVTAPEQQNSSPSSASYHQSAIAVEHARSVGEILYCALHELVEHQLDLLCSRLGHRLTSALLNAMSARKPAQQIVPAEMRGQGEFKTNWRSVLKGLECVTESAFFSKPLNKIQGGEQGLPKLTDVCLESLKAIESLESSAVAAGNARRRQCWKDVRNWSPTLTGAQRVSEVNLEELQLVLRQRMVRAEILWEVRNEWQKRSVKPRWEYLHKFFRAAWSPLAGQEEEGPRHLSPEWMLSCHKDMYMRQMLLEANDEFVDHSDAAYDFRMEANVNGGSETVVHEVLKPSSAVIAGEVGLIEDEREDEEGEADEEGQPLVTGTSISEVAVENVPAQGFEDITLAMAIDAELEATGQSLFGEHGWALDGISLGVGQVSHGSNGFLDALQGHWTVTMVLRQCLIKGVLALTSRSLIFFATEDPREFSPTSNSSCHLPAWLSRGYMQRWCLERLTEVLTASRLTEMWRRRQISNFQYLMQLNIIAGRSYNDITQYPVFPWVLTDYTSAELDLNNPASFRDLSKPVGALNEKRHADFLGRYSSFDDPVVPKFMYGTHYSSAGIVLHYLMRQEPFTSMHINLQGGKFDCPDRLFLDIAQCWEGCMKSMSDVKELTPEFFCCPEIFINSNSLPLGHMQDGSKVDDVRLPPWARDAYDFVRLHRRALESEHVSQHLHQWVDLVFGYKQRGSEAVKAGNVFYYLTYEGAVDLAQVNDPLQKDAMEAQINHFGQTPSQLFLDPHPQRLSPEECVQSLFSSVPSLNNLRVFSPKTWPKCGVDGPALLVQCTEEWLVCIHASLRVTAWAWSNLPDGTGLPFTLVPLKSRTIPSQKWHTNMVPCNMGCTTETEGAADGKLGNLSSQEQEEQTQRSGTKSIWTRISKLTDIKENLDGHEKDTDLTRNHPKVSLGISKLGWEARACVGISAAPASTPFVLSCGYWDNTVKCHSLDQSLKLRLVGEDNGGHYGAVTCLCMAEGGTLLVTGGEDATCRVWVVGNFMMAAALRDTGINGCGVSKDGSNERDLCCVQVLWGHEASVTCLAIREGLDLVFSGAADGRIVVHSLKGGQYIRELWSTAGPCRSSTVDRVPRGEVSQLTLSCHGDVVAHSWTDLSLHHFSLNGAHLATATSSTKLNCMLTAGGGEFLITGGQNGIVAVSTLHNLCVLHTIDIQHHGGITCMQISPDRQYLLVGSEDGEVSIVTDAKTRLQMLDLALRKAFVG